MLKLLPILFLAVINTANVNIFEIEGIFSSGHINALERYVDENSEKEKNLFEPVWSVFLKSENQECNHHLKKLNNHLKISLLQYSIFYIF